MSLDCEGAVGAVCDFAGCGVFDFLPWYCGDCGGRHCAKHRLPADHRCCAEEEALDVNEHNNSNNNDAKSSEQTTTGVLPQPPPPRYPKDEERVPIPCKVCGVDDCLLHQLAPDLVDKIREERRQALARRVWHGTFSPSSSTSKLNGTTMTTDTSSVNSSQRLGPAFSSSSAFPWRIGKFGNGKTASATANTTASLHTSTSRASADRLTATAKQAGHTMNLVCIVLLNQKKKATTTTSHNDDDNHDGDCGAATIRGTSRDEQQMLILFKKATFSHGVSVGYAADAIASLCTNDDALQAFSTSATPSSATTSSKHNQSQRPPTASLYLMTGGGDDASAFKHVSGSVDGGSLYLIDHLKKRDEDDDEDNATTNGASTDGNASKVNKGPGIGDSAFEKLMFAVIDADEGKKRKREEGEQENEESDSNNTALLQRVCALLMEPISKAIKMGKANNLEENAEFTDDHATQQVNSSGGEHVERKTKLVCFFPQFDASGCFATASGNADEKQTLSSSNTSSLTDKLLYQQVSATLRLSLQAAASSRKRQAKPSDNDKTNPVGAAVVDVGNKGNAGAEGKGGDEEKKNASEEEAEKRSNNMPLASEILSHADFVFYDDTTTTKPTSTAKKSSGVVFPFFPASPTTTEVPSNSSSSSTSTKTLADLPVAAPRLAPINAKDPTIARLSGPSKALVAVQILPLIVTNSSSSSASASSSAMEASASGGGDVVQKKQNLKQKHSLGKAFCLYLDGKWSVGKIVEKLRSEAMIPMRNTSLSNSSSTQWDVVRVSLENNHSLAGDQTTTMPTPFTLTHISKDLSVLGESVGVVNGAMLLFVEHRRDRNETTGEEEDGIAKVGETGNASGNEKIPLPLSLVKALENAYATPLPLPKAMATTAMNGPKRKLQPKIEAKIRKDCIVQ